MSQDVSNPSEFMMLYSVQDALVFLYFLQYFWIWHCLPSWPLTFSSIPTFQRSLVFLYLLESLSMFQHHRERHSILCIVQSSFKSKFILPVRSIFLFPKACFPITILLLISFSQYPSLEIILPRYLNCVTCSTRCPSTRIFNLWYPVHDIHITLVFLTLIFIPYFFVTCCVGLCLAGLDLLW